MNQLDFVARTLIGRSLDDAPDFVIASSPHPLVIFFAAAVAGRYDSKLAFEICDVWPEVIQEIVGFADWHPYVLLLRLAMRFAYRRADHVVTVKPGDDPFLEQRYPACRGKSRLKCRGHGWRSIARETCSSRASATRNMAPGRALVRRLLPRSQDRCDKP